MATFLLIIIYVGYIGLGVPDSLLGAAWPAIYRHFAIPSSFAGFISLATSACTFFSSLASARVINRFGTGVVAAFSTSITALALLGISFSGHWAFLLLFAIPLGLGAGAIDSGLNGYVALHYNAKQMSFLHCFYGVGVAVSPYLLSFALSGEGGWREGYRTVSFLQMGIAALLILSLPLWRKMRNAEPPENKQRVLPLKEIIKIKGIVPIWLMFIASCSVEACCTTWGSTYLVEHRGFDISDAAKTVTLYFIGLALGRILSGLISNYFTPRKIMAIGMAVLAVGIMVLIIASAPILGGIGLFLIGVGVGPIYPNLMHITPHLFGRDIAQSVMGTHMAAAWAGIMLVPPFFGWIAKNLSQSIFPYFLGLLLITLTISRKRLKA